MRSGSIRRSGGLNFQEVDEAEKKVEIMIKWGLRRVLAPFPLD